MSNLGLGLGVSRGIVPSAVPSVVEDFRTSAAKDFRTSALKNFRVQPTAPPSIYKYTLGDHEVAQTIYTTMQFSTGNTQGLLIAALSYQTWYNRHPGYLFSDDGKHLYTVAKHTNNLEFGILDWTLNTAWDMAGGYTGPTVEFIVTNAAYGAYPVIWGIEFDGNGDLILLFRGTGLAYLYHGYDLNTPFFISGEGTKTAADRSQSFGGWNNEGRAFAINDTNFMHIGYNGADMVQTSLAANDFPTTTMIDSVSPIPGIPVGIGLVAYSVHTYRKDGVWQGDELIISGAGASGFYYGIQRYSMSTPYDLSTLTLEEHIPFDAATTNYNYSKGNPNFFRWSSDGMKYYWGGNDNFGGLKISQVNN